MSLNVKKCVLIPGWRYDNRAIRTLLREAAPAWANFAVMSAGIYLGIGVGPEGHSLSWTSVLQKFESRRLYVRSLGLGLAATSLLYNMFAVTVLSYVAQVRPIPTGALSIEQRHLPLIIPARGNWISTDALFNLRQFLPFKVAPVSVLHSTVAAAMRNAEDGESSLVFRLQLEEIKIALATHGLLTHSFPQWFTASVASFLAHNAALGAQLGLDQSSSLSTQSAYYYGILNSTDCITYPGLSGYHSISTHVQDRHFDAWKYLARRCCRFFTPLEARFAASSALATAFYLQGMPPRVLSAVLKLWLNAWPLGFDDGVGHQCIACRGWFSEQNVAHLAQCPVVAAIHTRCLVHPPRSRRALLLLSSDKPRVLQKRAYILHALHRTFCFCRRNREADFASLFATFNRRDSWS